jgi:hypothetical protein
MVARLLCASALLVTAALAQTESYLTRGVGELSVSGGANLAPGYEPLAVPSFGLTYAVGLSHHFAATGNYVLDHYGNEARCFAVCGSRHRTDHEFTGGVRVSFPLRVITPYGVGMLGALRTSSRAEAVGVELNAARDWRFVGGGGLGMDIPLAPYAGFQLESRVMVDRSRFYYVRTMIGVYFRHR